MGRTLAETMGRFLNFSGRVVSKVRIKSFMIDQLTSNEETVLRDVSISFSLSESFTER